ncbi:MAG: hypothetical protein ACRD22_06490 [Terriglobia bacterium]
MAAVKPSSFERCDLGAPPQMEPILLYAPSPCALGTPYVESFSSYLIRLAEAHVVPLWHLIRYVRSQMCPGPVFHPNMHYTYPGNGLGQGSEILVDSFETATGRNDLRLLTLQALEGSIQSMTLFERRRRGVLVVWNNGEQKERRYIALYFGEFALLRSLRFTDPSW